MSDGIVPRQLAIIRGAIAELARLGLTVDSFSIDAEKVIELENLAVVARHIGAIDNATVNLENVIFPRTVAGIPLNVRRQ